MTGELSQGRLYMKKNGTASVVAPNYSDIISSKLNISKNDFDAAVRSAHSELVRSLKDFEWQFGMSPTIPDEKPAQKKNKKGKGGRPPKIASKGRPKSAGAKSKTAKGGTGAKRGRKPKNSSGKTIREAVAEAVRSGLNSTPAIADKLRSDGFDSKSLSTQVSQELSRLVKAGSVNRVGRGEYAWNENSKPTSDSNNAKEFDGVVAPSEGQTDNADMSV